MKKYFLLLLLFVFVANLTASDFVKKMDSYSQILLSKFDNKNQEDALLLANQLDYPFEVINSEIFVTSFVELQPNSANIFRTKEIISSVGNIYAVKIPVYKIKDLLTKSEVVQLSLSRRYRLHLDSARRSSRAHFANLGINLPKPYTGKGVILGIFDTGIDLLHSDFNNENGTRVLFLWDMGETVAPKPPEGFDWGREYTKQEIDNNIGDVLQKDRVGHGTHVAGIAGGNGSGKREYQGIAPEADFIVVNGVKQDGSNSFSDADILSACNYIFSKADQLGKPCVINLSLGTIIGSHDGEGLLSKALSNLVSQKKGRAIVASAGNEGELPIHSGGQVDKNSRYEILLYPYNLCTYAPELCPDIPNYFLIGSDIWSDVGVFDSIYVGIYAPDEFKLLGEKGFAIGDVVVKAQIFNDSNRLVGLASISNSIVGNSENILVWISNEGQPDLPLTEYLWTIVLVTKKEGRFDSWSGLPIGSQYTVPSRFQRFPADNAMTICSPADGKKIISVGSYVSKNKFENIYGDLEDWSEYYEIGSLAPFSSRGPSRDGRILPIITAPGMVIFSALSSYADPGYLDSTSIDPSGIYLGRSGTSMSAPVVSGAIALLFQQIPNLAIDETINLLKITANKDKFTTNIPNNDFGWGKLDVLRLLQVVTNVRQQIDSKKFAIFPNPSSEFIFVSSDETLMLVEIYDIFGNLVNSEASFKINISNLTNGLYLVKLKTTKAEYRSHFIKN